MTEPTKNEIVKNLRECVRFYGDLHAEILRIQTRHGEIQRLLQSRQVILLHKSLEPYTWDELAEVVGDKLCKSKIGLYDAGPDAVHQCRPDARGFTLLRLPATCDP